jgi:radical SAM superfamily enzyme YgiQ (UPF0313 family)
MGGNMLKVLFVQPFHQAEYHAQHFWIHEPLALEYVAAGIQGRHHAAIIDMRLDPDLEGWLEREQPHVVATTGYTMDFPAVFDILARAKTWRPETVTVVGGHHATVVPEDFVDSNADYIVVGEGVQTFAELTQAIAEQKTPDDIPGLAIPRHGQLTRTESRQYEDLDNIPFPDRELARPWRNHYFSGYFKPLANIRTSVGCPSRCQFCALWRLTGGKYLRRDPEMVVEELQRINHSEYVLFADDESLADAKRMKQLAELILEKGVHKKFSMYGRATTIVKHPDMIGLWRRAGLEVVMIGLESFRDSELEELNKRTDTRTNEKAVQICREHDVSVNGQFIINPDYDISDFRAVRRYVRHLRISHPTYSVLTPLPGTDLYEKQRANIMDTDHTLYDLLHAVVPTRLPLNKFYDQLSKLYLRTPGYLQTWRNLQSWPPGERLRTARLALRLFWNLRHYHCHHGNAQSAERSYRIRHQEAQRETCKRSGAGDCV